MSLVTFIDSAIGITKYPSVVVFPGRFFTCPTWKLLQDCNFYDPFCCGSLEGSR